MKPEDAMWGMKYRGVYHAIASYNWGWAYTACNMIGPDAPPVPYSTSHRRCRACVKALELATPAKEVPK